MSTRHGSLSAVFALLLAGCGLSAYDGPPDVLACDVTYRAGQLTEPEEATVEVTREVGGEVASESVTFAGGTDDELTFEVSYLSTHSSHGLIQIWMTTADGTSRNVQTIEFDGEYPGGPETTGGEDLGTSGTPAEYSCDAAG